MKALIQEIGEWNEMIAATFGGLKDALGGEGIGIEAPIADFSDFERLEFKGQKQEHLAPFLNAMKQLAEQQKVESE